MPTIDEALQMGWKQHQSGNVRGAEDVYRQVLVFAPTNENAWCFLGMACHDQGRFDEAASAYREALRIKPNFPVALSNFGNTLKQQGKLAEAEASCREALRCKPDYSTAYNNLGVVLVAQGRLEAAASTFEKSLSLMPNDAVAQANLGAALVRQGRFDEGSEISQRALKSNPNYAEAHKNQAIVWLLLGDFERGWPEYEWRWRCPGSSLPEVSGPRWDGSPVAGRTILLHWEQGLGDTIHFVRYARWFKQQGARVVVCCQKPLKRLLAWCDGIDELVAAGEAIPPFDFWTPLLSVPGVLKTDLATIPGDVGYIRADPALVEKWRTRLVDLPGFRIGITWQGSPDFHADRQRSIPLRYFERLARIPGVRLISLQKGVGTEQLAEIGGRFEIIDFGSELDDATGPFLDTAALMQCIELVVSADTSVPHLSAAMGVPTWVGHSVSPNWPWMLNRDDTPWYPTMRLFRQRTLGDWEGVFERMAQAITDEMANHKSTLQSVTSSAHSFPKEREPLPNGVIHSAGDHCLLRTRRGAMLCNPRDQHVGRSLELYGEYCEEELEFLCGLLRHGDIAVDVGAHLGEHVVPLAKCIGPTGVIHAFEPQRLDFQTLCANVALNGLENVHCWWQMIGCEQPKTGQQLSNSSEAEPLETLDALRLSACRLIKLDAPGGEQAVLAGSAATLDRCEPIVYIRNSRESDRPAVMDWLQSRGYRLHWHTPKLFRTANYHGRTDNIFGDLREVNILATPTTATVDVSGLRPVTGARSPLPAISP